MKPLYKRILGEQYSELPQAVQQLHDYDGTVAYRGKCNIQRGHNIISNIFASLLSLPKAGEGVEVEVKFTQEGERETWYRHFSGKPFKSLQWHKNGLLYERLNFTTLIFEVVASPEKLSLELRGLKVMGVPMLKFLRPDVVAEEREVNGKFEFTIHTTLPIIGLLVAYKGNLEKVV